MDREYKANEDLVLTIDYRSNWYNEIDPMNLGGSNGKGIRFIEPTVAEPKRKYQIWSMGEPEGNRYWFPCYDAPNDLRTTEFIATVENKFTVVSNGLLISTKENTNGTKTFHWKTDLPYSNHQTAFVIGEFADVKQNYNGIELHNYCNNDEVEATKASVERLPDMIKYFTEVTGQKFPYSSYSQVFVQDIPWGVTGPGLAIQTENMIDDYGTHADFYYLWDGLEGESLAQQWFGNYVSTSNWADIWLSKAFGRYFSNLYDEQKNGKDEFLIYQHSTFDHGYYFNDWANGVKQPVINKSYDDLDAFVGSNHPYFHGSSVLHMLRKHLGEENWWKAIRLYLKNNQTKLSNTEDFRKAIEEVSGEPMDWFFEQWLYKMGHPVFTITKSYDAKTQQLKLQVTQTQKIDKENIDPQVDFFKGKIAIEIDNKIETVTLEAKAENTFTFNCLQEPKLINFDYEGTWVKEMTFAKSKEELIYQLLNDKDILGRQWALNELAALASDDKTSKQVTEEIYSAFRNLIASNVYWRLKVNTLSQLRTLLFTNNPKLELDKATTTLLLQLIKTESSWLKTSAVTFLGFTKNKKYADIYIQCFNDKSDRVINAAANALGKSKSPKAFDTLVKLKDKPSWKSQSLISSLNGLKELGDPKGAEIALSALADLSIPRWTLTTPVWDYRIAAVQTLLALGKQAETYDLIKTRLTLALETNNVHDIFNNVYLIVSIADKRGQELFDKLKEKYKNDETILSAVTQYEQQFKDAIKQ